MAIVSMRDLLEAGVHFGHQTRRWNPKMQAYIFGERNGIYIIDLQKTLRAIRESYEFIRGRAAEGEMVLFVGTKKQAQSAVEEHAKQCEMYWVNNRWLGGMLTNHSTIIKSITRYKHLVSLAETGELESYAKKEQIQLQKQRLRMEKNLIGVKDMDDLPGVLFVVDTKREDIAVAEANRLGIPVVGVVDTNCDPTRIDFPIPGNDEAIRAIHLYCRIIADAVVTGRGQMAKEASEEESEGASEESKKEMAEAK